MAAQDTVVAFVTGAGRGIGRAIALALAERGFRVVVNDVQSSPDLDETVALVRASGAEALASVGDISQLDRHATLVAEAWSAFGRIDCLVNNAGVTGISICAGRSSLPRPAPAEWSPSHPKAFAASSPFPR